MSGSPIPATGVAWDTAVPDGRQPHGNDYNEHRETKLAVAARVGKEHVAFAGSSAGGEHKQGSARAYADDYSVSAAADAMPSKRPDGSTDLGSSDYGRLAIDIDSVFGGTGGVLYHYTATGWVKLGTVDLVGAQTIAGVKTFSSIPVLPATNPTTANQATRKGYVDSRIAVDSYAGNGGTTQAITGVGFQPRIVFIFPVADGVGGSSFVMTLGMSQAKNITNGEYEPDCIVSMDADGFTVGDGTGSSLSSVDGLNKSGITYRYIAIA